MKKLMAHARGSSSSNSNRKKRVGKYELGRTLGRGNSSVVKFATQVDTGDEVAIKILDKKKLLRRSKSVLENLEIRNAIKGEISIMKMVRHPNVVRIIEVMATKKKIYIVLEHVTGGELFNQIDKTGVTGMREGQSRRYFQQLISAVDYCHSRGVSHRDLKPENLLVDANGVLKVSDFGLSALPQKVRLDGLLHSACGTPNYVAPEVLRNQGYEGEKADIWSCGVILFFMIAGHLPFTTENRDNNVLYEKILRANYTSPPFFSSSLRSLIRRILDPNPATRITIHEIYEDEWFKRDYQPPRFSQDNISFDDDSEAGSSAPVSMMNAFEIMGTFLGFNLIGNLFNQVKRETRFISKAHADEIIAGIEHVAGNLGFEVKRRSYSKMSITNKGVAVHKAHLSIATEIFEIGPPFYMVEFRKAGGDTLEFHKFYKDLSARLQDIILKAEPIDTVTETDGAGPSTTTAGPSTSTAGAGPSTTTAGPSTSTAGPSTTTET